MYYNLKFFLLKNEFNKFLELIFKNGYLATCMQEEFRKRKLGKR